MCTRVYVCVCAECLSMHERVEIQKLGYPNIDFIDLDCCLRDPKRQVERSQSYVGNLYRTHIIPRCI